jgi:hypothetical protein
LSQALSPSGPWNLPATTAVKPRRGPDISDLGLPLARLARRWIVSGAFGRNTRGKTEKALDAVERLDIASIARGHRRHYI